MKRIIIQCPYCGNTQNNNLNPYCGVCNKEFNCEVIVSKIEMKEKITKDEFEAYESVRESGVTNMFDSKVVSELSGLDKEKITAIMKQYSDLKKEYRG